MRAISTIEKPKEQAQRSSKTSRRGFSARQESIKTRKGRARALMVMRIGLTHLPSFTTKFPSLWRSVKLSGAEV